MVTCLPLSSGQDAHALPEVLEKAQNTFEALGKGSDVLHGKILLLDTGYFSDANIEAAHQNSNVSYVQSKTPV